MEKIFEDLDELFKKYNLSSVEKGIYLKYIKKMIQDKQDGYKKQYSQLLFNLRVLEHWSDKVQPKDLGEAIFFSLCTLLRNDKTENVIKFLQREGWKLSTLDSRNFRAVKNGVGFMGILRHETIKKIQEVLNNDIQ